MKLQNKLAIPHQYQEYQHKGIRFRAGNPLPFGASVLEDGINFSFYSYHATGCILVLFKRGEPEPFVEIPIPDKFRIGFVYPITVLGLDPEEVEYSIRVAGPYDPEEGHRFNPDILLLDPYAKAFGGASTWGKRPQAEDTYHRRALILPPHDFDWGLDRPLEIPIEDLIIYEMHVRGFTRHPSSEAKDKGTYKGIIEKIPYLKELGVNCIELMPIFEFDEFDHSYTDPETGVTLLNYWGYSPLAFFAPKAGYAATPDPIDTIHELKNLIKTLHEHGIEVILDVVFNHTAEGNEKGPTISFKGIDNQTYYLLTPEGYYYNFSGTGNTFNCNHPTVSHFILDVLRYWVSEYHVDGFRFDLASIMTRDIDGMPLPDPPVLRMMAFDPVLGNTKLIAEPWDADGLYHLGSFPHYKRWSEWNGEYRDIVRKFLRGDAEQVGAMAQLIQGSPHIYPNRSPIATINFVTAHDGFTLMDLVSFNEKHNEANRELGDSGSNVNYSYNHGHEGPTDDPEINALRHRQIKNAIVILLTSQGVPMLLMGDEMGRTQHGNNNTYRQDNEMNWLNWELKETHAGLFNFFKACIAFRLAHPVLRNRYFHRHEDYLGSGYPDISLHGLQVGKPDYSSESRVLAFMLCGEHAKGGDIKDDPIYVAMNMHWEDQIFELPRLPTGKAWHVFANTGADIDFFTPGHEPILENQKKLPLMTHSVTILVGKPTQKKRRVQKKRTTKKE